MEYGFLSYLHLCVYFWFWFFFFGVGRGWLIVALVAIKRSLANQPLGGNPKFLDGIWFSHQDLYVLQFRFFFPGGPPPPRGKNSYCFRPTDRRFDAFHAKWIKDNHTINLRGNRWFPPQIDTSTAPHRHGTRPTFGAHPTFVVCPTFQLLCNFGWQIQTSAIQPLFSIYFESEDFKPACRHQFGFTQPNNTVAS
jgi:hypothetical protein